MAKSDNAQYAFMYKRTFHADIKYPATVIVVCHSIGFLQNPNTNDNFLFLNLSFLFSLLPLYGHITFIYLYIMFTFYVIVLDHL